MHPYGRGDDSGEIEQDFINWKKDLWKNWYKALPDIGQPENSENDIKEASKQVFEENAPRYILVNAEAAPKTNTTDLQKDFNYRKFDEFKVGQIVKITELRQMPTSELSTLKIDIKLAANDTYRTAENIVIYPKNTKSAVYKMLGYLLENGDQLVVLNPKLHPDIAQKVTLQFPLLWKLKRILRNFIDIKGAIKCGNKKINLEQDSRGASWKQKGRSVEDHRQSCIR